MRRDVKKKNDIITEQTIKLIENIQYNISINWLVLSDDGTDLCVC